MQVLHQSFLNYVSFFFSSHLLKTNHVSEIEMHNGYDAKYLQNNQKRNYIYIYCVSIFDGDVYINISFIAQK